MDDFLSLPLSSQAFILSCAVVVAFLLAILIVMRSSRRRMLFEASEPIEELAGTLDDAEDAAAFRTVTAVECGPLRRWRIVVEYGGAVYRHFVVAQRREETPDGRWLRFTGLADSDAKDEKHVSIHDRDLRIKRRHVVMVEDVTGREGSKAYHQ